MLENSEYSNEAGVIGDDQDTVLALSSQMSSSLLRSDGNSSATRPRIKLNDLPIIKSNFAGKQESASSSSTTTATDPRARGGSSSSGGGFGRIQAYKVGTYTYRGEHCDEVFAKKFQGLDVVSIHGVVDDKQHTLLADAMKFTHAYTVSLSPSQTRGCGTVVASKHPILRALWCDFFGVDGVAGRRPVGATVACKLELPDAKFLWVFAYQLDEAVLRAVGAPAPPSALPPDLAAKGVISNVDANGDVNSDVIALEHRLGVRKLSELGKLVAMTAGEDPDAGRAGVVVLGDFGVPNFRLDTDPPMTETAAREAAGAVVKAINSADQDAIGLTCEQVVARYVRPQGFPTVYLGLLVPGISHVRTRALFLTRLIARAVKAQAVKTLSRLFNINVDVAVLVAREKTLFLEYANLILHSWDIKSGEVNTAYKSEFWRAELKDKLALGGVLSEEERSYEYDLRRTLQPYPLIAALCDALHVLLKLETRLRIIDGAVADITEDDIVDIKLPALRIFPKIPTVRITADFLAVLTALGARDMCSEAILGLPDLGFTQSIPYTTSHVLTLNKFPERYKARPSATTTTTTATATTTAAATAGVGSVNVGSSSSSLPATTTPRSGQKASPALLRSSDIEKFFIVEDNVHFGVAATISFKV